MTTQLGIKEKGRRLELFSLIYLNPALFWRVVYSKGLKKKTKKQNKNKKHNKMIIHWDAFWDWGTEANSSISCGFFYLSYFCLTSSNPCECSILQESISTLPMLPGP